jgi:hydrogenase-4 component E
MRDLVDLLLLALVLSDFLLLGTSFFRTSIRLATTQGMLLGLLPLLDHEPTLRTVALAMGTVAVKAFAFPRILGYALRESGERREREPFVGYTLSLVLGAAFLGMSFWFSGRLSLPLDAGDSFAVPASFFTAATGLFLFVSRRQALHQILGYFVLENGIYIFGLAVVPDEPFLVEVGVLLDVLVAVLVMGFVLFHIHRHLETADVSQLSQLREDR